MAGLSANQELAAIDAELAWAESERDRLDQARARAKPGSRRERDLLDELHEVDLEIERLNIRRHRLVCEMSCERHLRIVTSSKQERKKQHAQAR